MKNELFVIDLRHSRDSDSDYFIAQTWDEALAVVGEWWSKSYDGVYDPSASSVIERFKISSYEDPDDLDVIIENEVFWLTHSDGEGPCAIIKKACERARATPVIAGTYYFDVRRSDAGVCGGTVTWASIASQEDWENDHRQGDCPYEELLDVMQDNDFYEAMENVFETELSVEDARKKLLSLGLKENEAFSKFISDCYDSTEEEVVKDVVASLINSASSFDCSKVQSTSKKITTETCKKAIVDFLGKNPGLVSHLFALEDRAWPRLNSATFETPALNPHNWKRTGKRKVDGGEGHVRDFCCTAGDFYEDMLRAYVYDDGKTIRTVEVEVE